MKTKELQKIYDEVKGLQADFERECAVVESSENHNAKNVARKNIRTYFDAFKMLVFDNKLLDLLSVDGLEDLDETPESLSIYKNFFRADVGLFLENLHQRIGVAKFEWFYIFS